MKVLFEGLGVQDYGGGRTATLNTLRALLKHGPEHEYTILLSQPEPDLEEISARSTQIVVNAKNRFMARLWLQRRLPVLARQHDLVHFAKNLSVFGLGRPAIVTMYDMTTLVYPHLLPAIDVWYWRTVQRLTIHQSSKVIAISENTKADIHRFYRVPDSKVSTIYPAIGEHFQPASEGDIRWIEGQYDIVSPYIIHVGRLDPKNNIACLIQAFARLSNQSELQLVVVGGRDKKSPDDGLMVEADRLGVGDKIVFTGRVTDAELPLLVSGARLAVFPSHHEGFGLAAVEALACGTPAVVHKAGALAEAVGDAGYVIDEINPETLSHAIQLLLDDKHLYEGLAQKGIQRSRQFNLETHAHEILQAYDSVVN